MVLRNGTRPFLWINGTMHDLGSFGGERGEAQAVNNMNEVVGWSHDDTGQPIRFLYSNGYGMNKLADLIQDPLQAMAYAALDPAANVRINDADEITGNGRDANGNFVAYVLTPIVQP